MRSSAAGACWIIRLVALQQRQIFCKSPESRISTPSEQSITHHSTASCALDASCKLHSCLEVK